MNSEDYVKKIRLSFWIVITVTIISIFLTLLGYYGILKPAADKPEIWFQRVGALVTCLGFVVEIALYRSSPFFGDLSENRATENNRLLLILSKTIAFFLPIYGAIIWGYGDLIYTTINK